MEKANMEARAAVLMSTSSGSDCLLPVENPDTLDSSGNAPRKKLKTKKELDSMRRSVGSHCECMGGAGKCGSTARARIDERLTAGLSTGEPLAPNGYHLGEHAEPFKLPAVT